MYLDCTEPISVHVNCWLDSYNTSVDVLTQIFDSWKGAQTPLKISWHQIPLELQKINFLLELLIINL